jgi:hypothetical protein
MAAVLTWLPLLLRRRKREQALALAQHWPIANAKLLKSNVVEKDPLAEGNTAFQDRQVEAAFYFTHEGAYFGGHLRSVPLSDSEAHRALRSVPEDTPVLVRYNPHNPDQAHTLATDNEAFPFQIWPG